MTSYGRALPLPFTLHSSYKKFATFAESLLAVRVIHFYIRTTRTIVINSHKFLLFIHKHNLLTGDLYYAGKVVYYSGASFLEYVKIEEKRIILFIMTSR